MTDVRRPRPTHLKHPDRQWLLGALGRLTAAEAGLGGLPNPSSSATPARLAAPGNPEEGLSPTLSNTSEQVRKLGQMARRARAALEAEIGPRGLTIGHLVLQGGRTSPIHAASPAAAKKIMRAANFGPGQLENRAAVVAAVRAACEVWDVAADRAGVTALQRQSEAARRQLAARIARAGDR